MINKYFHKYLINLEFSEKDLEVCTDENIFSYSPSENIPSIKYILVNNEGDIFNYHLQLWNRNTDNVFVAVDENKTHIIDCKRKPQRGVIKSIETFNYGINSEGYENIEIDVISKSYIDSSFFHQYIRQKQLKKQEVDKDLLLNLIALRNDLIVFGSEKVIHLLILRSLFVKYLEDRGIFTPNYLSDILQSKSPDKLIDAFGEVCKINGDVFGGNRLTTSDINVNYLEKLHLFFTTDYQSGQGTLFPYQFDNIPIQLISHVYEAFLNNNTKKGKGVYYTPSFVVNFMLSQSLKEKAKANPYLTVFDPAVGSGAFLVESFKIIRNIQSEKLNRRLEFDEKKRILEKQLWGIDIDSDALQITAFSLYLALLEDESSVFIQNKIEHSHPILPSLIDGVLVHANSLTDTVFEGQKFDFIVSNPPWGSVPDDKKEEHIAEREAIDNKSGLYPEYNQVSNYERSQAFLRRVVRWQNNDTTVVMIVKNSIFLNDKAIGFRKEFLEKNLVKTFYELSNYNKILFRKRVIGKIRGKVPIEIGASEPCAIVIFQPNSNNDDYKINYIAPKLTKFGEHFEVIQHTTNESFHIDKSDFIEKDKLWRVLVNSDFEGFTLIENKIIPQAELLIEARSGFKPKQNMMQLGEPIWKKKIEPTDFDAYYLKNKKLDLFNWNQELERRRDENIFRNSRIIISVRPLKSDMRKLRGLHLTDEIIFKHNTLGIKLIDSKGYLLNHIPYLGLVNSMVLGFYIYNISSQWGKGEEKRATIRNVDIETLPIKNLEDKKHFKRISEKINDYISAREEGRNEKKLLEEIDEIVFNLYGLTEYEKEIINEFYQINVERANERLKFVQPNDIQKYFQTFKETFELVLSSNHTLNATFSISQNIGAIIKISIEKKTTEKALEQDNTMQVLQFVKNRQLTETDKLLKEEKVKLYESTSFYLLKSNQFKDWTKRQALKDAKEEIDLLFSKLPETYE